jgi:hypothetical protein
MGKNDEIGCENILIKLHYLVNLIFNIDKYTIKLYIETESVSVAIETKELH